MHLRRYILDNAGLLPDDPAARGASNRLRANARRNKEILFSEGRLTVQVGDDLLDVTAQEFLADKHVVDFATRVRETIPDGVFMHPWNLVDRRTPRSTHGACALQSPKRFVGVPREQLPSV